MNNREVPHLRLIVTRTDGTGKTARSSMPRGHQLAFPYPKTSTVVFLHVATIRRDEFTKILGDYMPRWIIDVRAVPRLDTIADSRRSAFTLFERARASYVDLFGRLGIKSYGAVESNPAFWSSAVSDLLLQSDRTGPYLFLFDNEQLLSSADRILPAVIKRVVGKAAHFARLGQGETDRNGPID